MISDLGFFGVKYLPSAKYLDVKKVSLNSLSQICSLSKVAIFMPGLLLANILLPNFLKYETKINVFIRPLTCWLDRRPQEGWMSDLESFVRLNWFLNHAIFYLERLKRLMKEDSKSNIFFGSIPNQKEITSLHEARKYKKSYCCRQKHLM